MANPYTSGHTTVDPFADDFSRPRAPPETSVPPPQNPVYYEPQGPSAATSVPYQPPPAPSTGAAPQQVTTAQPAPEEPPADRPPAQARDLQTSKFWTIEFYQQLFDVDTKDVTLRMGNTLLPFSPPDFLAERNWHSGIGGDKLRLFGAAFTAQKERTPDMYGPFWLCTTLWVVLAIVGNIMSKLAYNKKVRDHDAAAATLKGTSITLAPVGPWSYDFTVASVACFTIYAFCSIMPACVWGLMFWKQVPAGLLDVLCLYGYSMFTFLLAAILCAFPSGIFQWIVCILCGLWSLVYLLANLWKLWKVSLEKAWFIGLVLFVSICHVGLFLAFKLYFLNYNF